MKFVLASLFILIVSFSYAQEICNNGIDDDFDGLIDLQDTVDCTSCLLAISDTSFTSLVPNPSFENRTCCPAGAAETNCVNNWMAASYATPDYFFVSSTCNYSQLGGILGPATPLPNGNGYVGLYSGQVGTGSGDYREYIGTCLPTPLFAGINYQVEFYLTTDTLAGPTGTFSFPRKTEFSIFGTPLCSDLPVVIIPGFSSCLPKASSSGYNWAHLATTNIPANRNWTRITLNFTPTVNISAIAFGTSCVDTNINRYQYLDDIRLNKTVYFNAKKAAIIDTGTLCKGDLFLTAIYNKRPKSFQWYKDSIALVGDTNGRYNVPINGAGSYQVILQYDSNCIITKTFIVKPSIFPKASFYSKPVCIGLETFLFDNSTISSGSIDKWNWSLGKTPNLSTNSTTFPTSGANPVTLEVTSNDGCKDDTTINSIIYPLPKIDFNFSPTDINLFNTNVCFNNLSSGANSYLWDFDFVGVNGKSNLISPCTVTFPDQRGRTYFVKLTGVSQYGCIDSMTKIISITENFILYIPNSFTPNDDGINDRLKIVTGGIKSFELIIFNRWGEKIFSTSSLNDFWDGTHQGENAPLGTYVYKVLISAESGKVKEVIGNINLIR
jgi:gliding motility-associated-like protein